MRKVLGEVPLFTVLSADRIALMNRIRESANTEAQQFGIEIIDVRIKRADLPAENSQAIYRRMQTEREREAKELRAQGAELAQRIRARADRERRVIIAEAEKESEIIRGEGDADSVRIFADAVGRDVDFFTFYRSMQAYRNALGDENTSFVLSPDSEFFRFFDSPTLPPVEQASAPAQARRTAIRPAPPCRRRRRAGVDRGAAAGDGGHRLGPGMDADACPRRRGGASGPGRGTRRGSALRRSDGGRPWSGCGVEACDPEPLRTGRRGRAC